VILAMVQQLLHREMGLFAGSDWHNVAQSRSQHHGNWVRAAVRPALILALALTSCVGGPHPEPPRASMDLGGRAEVPAAGADAMMGPGGAPVAPSTPAAAPGVAAGAGGSSGSAGPAGGGAAPVSDSGCASLDSGLPDASMPDAGMPDAGMIDAGAGAAMPDCDDDAGI
jgi:hypothetical protein